MLINVDRLPKEGLNVTRGFDFPTSDLIDENAVFLEPVQAELLIRKEGDEVWIKGAVATRLSFVCSRCLTPFEFDVDSKFDLVFLPGEIDGSRDELDDEDLDKMYYYDNAIDLRFVVLEQLNLLFPPKPLCSEDCEGICAVCGELVCDGRCSCQVKESDPRLEKLKILVKDKR